MRTLIRVLLSVTGGILLLPGICGVLVSFVAPNEFAALSIAVGIVGIALLVASSGLKKK